MIERFSTARPTRPRSRWFARRFRRQPSSVARGSRFSRESSGLDRSSEASTRPELGGTGTFHRLTAPRSSDGTENEARFFEDWRRLYRRGDIGEFQAAKHGRAREQSQTERLLGRATPSSQPRDRTRGRKQSVEDDWPRRYLTIRVCQIRPREGTRGPRLYSGERRAFTTLSASSCLLGVDFGGSPVA